MILGAGRDPRNGRYTNFSDTTNGMAFGNCTNLTSLDFPRSIEKVYTAQLFYNCPVLEKVTFAAGSKAELEVVGTTATYMFNSCPKLKTIDFGEGSEINVPAWMVHGSCEALKEVLHINGVVGQAAFRNSQGPVSELVFGPECTELGWRALAFSSNTLTSLTFEANAPIKFAKGPKASNTGGTLWGNAGAIRDSMDILFTGSNVSIVDEDDLSFGNANANFPAKTLNVTYCSKSIREFFKQVQSNPPKTAAGDTVTVNLIEVSEAAMSTQQAIASLTVPSDASDADAVKAADEAASAAAGKYAELSQEDKALITNYVDLLEKQVAIAGLKAEVAEAQAQADKEQAVAAAEEAVAKAACEAAGVEYDAEKSAAENVAAASAATAEKAAADAKASVKQDNTMTAAGKTVKAKAKKKTKIAVGKAFAVNNAVGKVTYAKVSGNAKISVAANGKVTVKKGLKKGKSYKVKVLVCAQGDATHAPTVQTVTLTVKVTK